MDRVTCAEPDDHISKAAEQELRRSEDGKNIYWVTTLWGCTKCDATSPDVWPGFGQMKTSGDGQHKLGDPFCNCFGCKAKTLHMNAGDATRDIPDKKWNAELNEYKKARAEGIQPAGTTYAQIEAARTASETLGKAYNSETMPKAHQINKQTAEVMKEIGQV